ncbi:MAG: hypothetical protein PWR03_2246 [Tenuifilum sp.]|nr:hypothetical protein [Tenuifilum sp.]
MFIKKRPILRTLFYYYQTNMGKQINKNIITIFLLAGMIKSTAYGQEHMKDSAWLASTYNYLLMVEADSGNIEKVRTLLNLGADPNTCDANGVTPLMFAIQSGNTDVVELLVENGADINAVPYDGNTALHAAISTFNDTIAELLIEKGADINVKNNKKLSPLHLAAWHGLPFLTELLLYKGAKPNEQDMVQNTPLMLATFSGATTCTHLLLKYGADPNIQDRKGRTPLMVASQFNDTSIAKLLIEYGADINIIDENGANALSYAIAFNANDVLKLLLDFNAHETKLQKSYYQIAREYYNIDALKTLSEMGLKTKIKPKLSSLFAGSSITFAQHEFLWGFCFGGVEQISQVDLSVGYLFRPFKIATLTSTDGQLYQYWEYRQVIQSSISKNFYLLSLNKCMVRSFLKINAGMEFRNYRGTHKDLSKQFSSNFNAGISFKFNIMEYSLGFGYNFKEETGNKPYFYTISAKIHFNQLKPKILKKNVNYIW